MKGYKFIRREGVCAAFVIAESREAAERDLEANLAHHGDPLWHRENTDVTEIDLSTGATGVALVVTTHYARNDR
jgi:hypothetical protein